MKTVGVVMATFNGERFLTEQLDSICSQTRKPEQILIVDDGSTDGTEKVIRGYVDRFPGLISYLPSHDNVGVKPSFEKAIARCGSDYIALSDQDDIWEANKLENLCSVLEGDPQSLFCFHDLALIDPSGVFQGKNFWEIALPGQPLPVMGSDARLRIVNLSNPVPGCTMFFSAQLKKDLLPMPTSPWIGHDLWISAVAFFLDSPKIVFEPLGRYRLHSAQSAGIASSGQFNRERPRMTLIAKMEREIIRIFRQGLFGRRRLRDRKIRARDISEALLNLMDRCEERSCCPAEELSRLREVCRSRL